MLNIQLPLWTFSGRKLKFGVDTTYRLLKVSKWIIRNVTFLKGLGFDYFGKKTCFCPIFMKIKMKVTDVIDY